MTKVTRQHKIFSHSIQFIFVLIYSFLFFSCASLPRKDSTPFGTNAHLPHNCSITKNYKPSTNTEYFCFENKDFPLVYHIVKVNLAESVKFSQFPHFWDNGKIQFMSTKEFAQKNNATIAINTTQFSFGNPKIIGIGIEDYIQFSNPVGKYAALVIEENIAKIVQQSEKSAFQNVPLAVGGFFTIIKDGDHFGQYLQNRDSRTALGISKNGKNLVILVVEGERQFQSAGLSYFECAEILREFDVWDALQFDSGASSALYINQRNAMNYPCVRKIPLNLAIIDE